MHKLLVYKQHMHIYYTHVNIVVCSLCCTALYISSNFNVLIMIRVVIDLKRLYLVVCHNNNNNNNRVSNENKVVLLFCCFC